MLKGYKYGKSYIPFSKYDEKLMRYSASKCMQLIGFTDSRAVPRHHLLASVECICAEPSEANAAVALSALIHALAGIPPSSFLPFCFCLTIVSFRNRQCSHRQVRSQEFRKREAGGADAVHQGSLRVPVPCRPPLQRGPSSIPVRSFGHKTHQKEVEAI